MTASIATWIPRSTLRSTVFPLPDDLSHTYASRALALGEELPIIRRLLSHRGVETAPRYAHLARDPVREPEERIAVSIAKEVLLAVR